MDDAAKMNLLAYSRGDFLDHLGAFYGVKRLEASSASCTVKFMLSAPLQHNIDIPIGTRISPDGKLYFATTELLRIEAGQTEGSVICICTEAGTIGNDYVPGQISKLVDPFAYELQCQNIDTSSGGTDQEEDTPYRERIQIAPESFSTAGSIKGYEYFALSADPNIIDACVLTCSNSEEVAPGYVDIYVLLKGGALPDEETCNKVLAFCNAEDIRPATDRVRVKPPEVVRYDCNVCYWIDEQDSSQCEAIQSRVAAAVQEWVNWQGRKLGRDINPSRLSHDIIAAGAKRCEIISPQFTILTPMQTAKITSPLCISFQGLE